MWSSFLGVHMNSSGAPVLIRSIATYSLSVEGGIFFSESEIVLEAMYEERHWCEHFYSS